MRRTRRGAKVVTWLCLLALVAGVVTLSAPPLLLPAPLALGEPAPTRVAHVDDPGLPTASVRLDTVGARPPPLS
jgi:hypothetical protein